MSESMVEHVARAIAVAAGDDPDEISRSQHQPEYPRWIEWKREARAAIEAMREPTDAMMDAAGSIVGGGFQNGHSDAETWQAMIDAALKE